MNIMNNITLKKKKGIDDLINVYAWTGNSQGDESYTNNIEEGLASQGWMSYNFKDIDITDQKAINKESERRKKVNQDYINKLKEEGKYGEEYEVKIYIQPNPIFDNKQPSGSPLESFKMVFLDENNELKSLPNT